MKILALTLLALVALAVVPAAAEEAKTPVSAVLLLSTFSASTPSRAAAYDEALRDGAPAAPRASDGEVLPDGSVRYGKVIVTVRNPCPPGSGHEEPLALPGRRARR